MRIEDLIKTHKIFFVEVSTEHFVKKKFVKARKQKYYYNFPEEEIESFNAVFLKQLNIVKRFVSSKYFHKGYFVVFSLGSFSEEYFEIYDREKSLLDRFPENVYRIEEFSEEKFSRLAEECFYKKYREALLNNENLSLESMFFVALKTETSLIVKKLFLKMHYSLHGVF
ncbi:hypothetical protein TMA_126 [Thermus phage TMA]|uniref:hypothetical protein n=1 Tax=Thermus phage TMA TaxID=699370 RepID=UPI00021AADEE|nr:hypothetical protein TMA_126 [Thermus phage TMA]BAK53814.1 hypothetical protein TMA_126 [Thermus phage TMA]